MGERVGANVEIVIVLRLIDGDAPQHNTRTIQVAADHAADIVDCQQFPGFVADVLPSGNFFKDEQADFVAGIEKMPRLRVMRRPYDIALEIVAEDVSVAALGPSGHGLADPGERLMAIESAQLDDFAIQLKTMIGELRFAETDDAGILID